jgi:hypothetical protein
MIGARNHISRSPEILSAFNACSYAIDTGMGALHVAQTMRLRIRDDHIGGSSFSSEVEDGASIIDWITIVEVRL